MAVVLNMYRLSAVLAVLGFFTSCKSSSPPNQATDAGSGPVWTGTKQAGTTGADYCEGIALDTAGSLYLALSTGGTFPGRDAGGNMDVAVAMYSAAGEMAWVNQVGTQHYEYATKVVVDDAGNSYATGFTFGSFAPDFVNDGGLEDSFVIKFGPTGEVLWKEQLRDPAADRAAGMAIDPAGSAVYVVGFTRGDAGAAANAGGQDAFLAKFNASGNREWLRQLGTQGDDIAQGVAVDSTGTFVYVTGYTRGVFGGQGLSDAGLEIFVSKVSSANSVEWTRQFGSPRDDIGRAVVVDTANNIFIAGFTFGDFGTAAGTAFADGGSYPDAVAFKLDADGGVVWARTIATSAGDFFADVKLNAAGTLVYATGWTGGDLDGGGAAGGDDVFTVALSAATGEVQWTNQFGSSSFDYPRGIAVDSSGSAFVCGYTGGNLDGNVLIGADAGASADYFVSKYSSSGVRQ